MDMDEVIMNDMNDMSMNEVTEQTIFNHTEQQFIKKDNYEKYYKRACEVCVPIVLKVPVFVSPVVIETPPKCVDTKDC